MNIQKQWLIMMVAVAVTLFGLFGWDLIQTLSGAKLEFSYVVSKIEPGIFPQPVESLLQKDFANQGITVPLEPEPTVPTDTFN
jgi:hypothetical protein